MMTTTIDVRGSGTRARCPFHNTVTTLTHVQYQKPDEGTKLEFAGRPAYPVICWVLFCECVVSSEDYTLVTPSRIGKAGVSELSAFMRKKDDPNRAECSMCRQFIPVYELESGRFVLGAHKGAGFGQGRCPLGGTFVDTAATIHNATTKEDDEMTNDSSRQ